MPKVESKQDTFLGHPKGLFYLFFAEMWERFSFYGMRALLVLYMTQYLFLTPDKSGTVIGYETVRHALEAVFGTLNIQAFSSQIYGLYTGFVYFTPFFGGILADRYLGQKRSVYIGGLFFIAGHFLMAVESMFFPALALLCIGNGFFKPNISTQVGGLYEKGDPRRDRAYTIFYMGINAGALLAPLVCGTLGQKLGWHYGFAAAGVGMIIGLIGFYVGRKHLPDDAHKRAAAALARKNKTQEKMSKQDYKQLGVLAFVCFIVIVFWGVYEQQGNTLQLWADKYVDWNLLGFEIPSTWFQSFNPLFIILFAPALDRLWAWQGKREPNSITKMGLGCLLAGVAYLFMLLTLKVVGVGNRGNMLWVMGTVWFFTIGELYLSPIGLSLVTKLAPAKMVSMIMGVWFLATFVGNYAAGFIGSYYERMTQEGFFLFLAVIAIGAAALLMVGGRVLRQTMRET